MRLSSKVVAIGSIVVMSSSSAVVHAADIIIGVPNWPSVLATAHILKVAMEDNLGLEVELKSGSNPDLFAQMDSGSVHVHPEVWLPNNDNLKKQFVDAKKTVKMSDNFVSGEQAMCVTQGTADRTGIVDLSELNNPAMAKNFDSDGDGEGEVWIGGSEWASTTIEQIRARSYGYDSTMTLKKMDESVALAEVEDAIANDTNIVFFCYSPHHMFELYDLVKLKEPAYNAKDWQIVQPSATPGWLEKSRAGVAWDSSSLHISYATALESEQPAATKMLSNISLDTETVSAMTYALVVQNQDPAEYASKWVEEHASVVKSWLE